MKFRITKDGLVNKKKLFNDDLSPQQYSRVAVHTVLEELGIKVEEEWEMTDNSIELVCTRWVA